MVRRSLIACSLALLAGCQDYRFNPVGKCFIQPGASRITLAGQSTADILFVVDDSGSMKPEQDLLANNFGAFIDSLAQAQQLRAQNGLDPFEFHLAITTSSVFEGEQTPGFACGGSPLSCNITRPFASDEVPAGQTFTPISYSCPSVGAPCAELVQSYHNIAAAKCILGVGQPGAPYPAGDFVAAAGNPRVLHFTKGLNWANASTDPQIQQLVQQFQQNIAVGTCGSGMEQHLEAGRLAVQKAIAGTQPGVTKGEWPHADAKMVVVWVGDEDDCSNVNDKQNPLNSLFFPGSSNPGADVCFAAEDPTSPDHKKLFAIPDYASYFAGLGKPFSAAFIYSGINCAPDANGNVVCQASACNPSTGGPVACGAPFDSCTGKSNGHRFHDLSEALRGSTAKVNGKDTPIATLDASVCDQNFANTLQGIAALVKPPAGLKLPTQPASSQVALLRIESADGSTSKQCTGPATTAADAQATSAGKDWWFVDCASGAAVLDRTTSCITINHATNHCEANPGETYVAQYLGLVPQPSAANPQGGCATVNDCAVLGVSTTVAQDWSCVGASSIQRGTCVCNGG